MWPFRGCDLHGLFLAGRGFAPLRRDGMRNIECIFSADDGKKSEWNLNHCQLGRRRFCHYGYLRCEVVVVIENYRVIQAREGLCLSKHGHDDNLGQARQGSNGAKSRSRRVILVSRPSSISRLRTSFDTRLCQRVLTHPIEIISVDSKLVLKSKVESALQDEIHKLRDAGV